MMRGWFAAAGIAVALAGCASPPAVSPPTISYDGHFGGTVVADRVTPVSTRYQDLCEGPAGRWRDGGYRPYAACDTSQHTVQARD